MSIKKYVRDLTHFLQPGHRNIKSHQSKISVPPVEIASPISPRNIKSHRSKISITNQSEEHKVPGQKYHFPPVKIVSPISPRNIKSHRSKISVPPVKN